MSTSMLVRVALAAVAGVALAGGPSTAPVATSVSPSADTVPVVSQTVAPDAG